MDINTRIEEQLKSHDILLYMKGTPDFPQCGFSGLSTQILQQCDVRFASVDVLADNAVREGIKQYSNWPTIPQLYIKGEFIGGSDIIKEMFENGELKTKLEGVAV